MVHKPTSVSKWQMSNRFNNLNFGARTFTYRRPAQGLNRSLSESNSFVRKYLDPVVKADRSAQYIDDIEIAAHTADELLQSIDLVFQGIEFADLKLSMCKCLSGLIKIEHLGKTNSKQGRALLPENIDRFLISLELLTSVTSLQSYIGFVNVYRQYIPKLAKKLLPLYQLNFLKRNFNWFKSTKTRLPTSTKLSPRQPIFPLRLPLPDQLLVKTCDISQHAAGYVLLIEGNANDNTAASKAYAPVAFGSRRFTTGQMFLTMYAKDFLAMHSAFDEFGHVSWGVTKPIKAMTDNKASNRFFKLSRFLWNCGISVTRPISSISYSHMYQISRFPPLTTFLG